MSDDEGPDAYAEYDGVGGAGDGEGEPEPELEPEVPDDEGAGEPDDGLGPEPDDDEELGLDEDAAGTDEGTDDDEAGEEAAEPAGASRKAAPQRAKVDPLLRASNQHRIIRIVPPEERVTDNRLQTAEAAYIIAKRAEQIAQYATHFALSAERLHDPVAIAYKELFDRRCPLVLRRPVGSGPAGEMIVEDWVVREMTLPPLTPPAGPTGSYQHA